MTILKKKCLGNFLVLGLSFGFNLFSQNVLASTSEQECLNWGDAQGTMGASSYCSMKLNLDPLQDQIQPAPSDCRPFENAMLARCEKQMLKDAQAYFSPTGKSCRPFTLGNFINDYTLEKSMNCKAGSLFMETKEEDFLKGCLVTKVVREGRSSLIQVANYCDRVLEINNTEITWGNRINNGDLGNHPIKFIVGPSYDGTNPIKYITILKVKAQGFFGSWDFKYTLYFTLLKEDGITPTAYQSQCHHWINVPNIIEKVCQ